MKILVTGGCGFIGSSFVKYLNDKGITNIDICEAKDQFESKWQNIYDLTFNQIITSDILVNYVSHYRYDAIVHLGANSDTSQPPTKDNWENNISLTESMILKNLYRNPIFIFASSASVYGNGIDFTETAAVKPTSFYGFTKLEVEKKIAKLSKKYSENIYSLRFFNVYGGRERYKNIDKNMSSPIFKWLHQKEKAITLFLSGNSNYKLTDMKRDFVYVYDVCDVIYHCIINKGRGGTYNVGSGIATGWETIAKEIFKAKNINDGNISYRLMPEQITKYYQYYTCANLNKLRNELGYQKDFTSIEEGIKLSLQEINNIY